jgi:hypothetical protein
MQGRKVAEQPLVVLQNGGAALYKERDECQHETASQPDFIQANGIRIAL